MWKENEPREDLALKGLLQKPAKGERLAEGGWKDGQNLRDMRTRIVVGSATTWGIWGLTGVKAKRLMC